MDAAVPKIVPVRHVLRSTVRGVALVLLLMQGLACVAPMPAYRAVPNYPVRIADIETIALVPPLVSVYSMSSGNIEQEVQEWSDAANSLAQVAVRKRIESLGKRFVAYAGEAGPRPDFRLAPQRLESERAMQTPAGESWLLFESAKEAILRHTYDLGQLFPLRVEEFDYSLGPESRSLLAGTSADAFLLMIATDYVPTAERQVLIGVGAAAALYTGGYGGPGTTPAELTAALVESASGDIIWFNKVSMPLSDLRDPKGNAALVDLVLEGIGQ